MNRSINFTLLITTLFFAIAFSQNDFYPVPIRRGLKQYIAFGPELYSFNLPSLTTNTRNTYSKTISFAPTSVDATTLYFSKENNEGDFEINTSTFALQEAARAVPNGQPSTGDLGFLESKKCVVDGSTTYCFYSGNPATLVKTVAGTPGNTTFSLGQELSSSRFLKVDKAAGVLHVTGQLQVNRGGNNMSYWQFSLSPFALKNGPVALTNTYISGCPVEPRGCGVPVLLYMDATDGVISWVYSVAIANPAAGATTYQINLVAYSFTTCGTATFDDVNQKNPVIGNKNCATPVATSAPTQAPTSAPTSAPTQPPSSCPKECGTQPCCSDIRLGVVCYNPNTHQCVVNNPNNGNVLCGGKDKSCGGYCYDATLYGCNNGSLYHL